VIVDIFFEELIKKGTLEKVLVGWAGKNSRAMDAAGSYITDTQSFCVPRKMLCDIKAIHWNKFEKFFILYTLRQAAGNKN